MVGLKGERIGTQHIRRNGTWRTVEIDSIDSGPENSRERQEPSKLKEYLRRVSAEIARYRNNKTLSETAMRTIVAMWQDGKGLRQFSRDEGVSAEAIEDRIVRLRFKAPRFFDWWRAKNVNRRKK